MKESAMSSLSGKVAVITGSTSGIGLAIAQHLAAEGAKIVLNGFGDPDQIEATRVGIAAQNNVDVIYDPADMTKPVEIARMIADTEARFGVVDVLVNNAGIQHVSPIEDFPLDKWDAIIAINMSSAFHTIRAALPGMKSRGWGRIINLASAHGLIASPFKSAYVTAKHGMIGLTKTVALETARDGITCNAICPGYVRTPLVEAQIPATAQARGITEDEVINDVMLPSQPTKRFIGVDEIGALAVFLTSGGAASITGASMQIDGGWTAQ
jgi:3-hydroxybutyrate dehydrogenase